MVPKTLVHNNMALYDNKFRWQKVCSSLLALALLPIQASAASDDDFNEERWYQVELIVFAHRDRDALDAEDWPEIEGLSLPEKLTELSLPPPQAPGGEEAAAEATAEPVPSLPPATADTELTPADTAEASAETAAAMPVAFQMLDEAEWQLTDVEKKLRRSSRYEPLLHVAWRQPTYDENRSQTVLLYEGMTAPLPEEALQASAESEDPGTAAMAPVSPVSEPLATEPRLATEEDVNTGAINPRMAGTVRVSVARYLHVDADLVYRAPVTQHSPVQVPDLTLWYDRPYATLYDPQGPAYVQEQWQALRGFRLLESRRMRSREVHYLDHPFFGIIVLITPVELPKPEEEESAPPAPTHLLLTPGS